MPNLDNSELIHAFGDTWKNHKYIKKIGNRYFYTMDELRKYNVNKYTRPKGISSEVQRRVTRTPVAKKTQTGTIGSTNDSKKKQSIGEAFTSGIKSAGQWISDVTGETDRKRAEAIDAGKQFAKETASKVSTGVSELATKASDTVASGLAWVESVFAPKKKK